MKPPSNNQSVNHSSTITRLVDQRRADLHTVAAIQTFALKNEFTLPVIRTIWTALAQSGKDAEDDQRRKKR